MKPILIIVLLLITVAPITATVPIAELRPNLPDDNTPITFNINVRIYADTPLRDTAKAIIARELNKQEDIKLVDDHSEVMLIQCVIEPLKNGQGVPLGYVLSWVVASHMDDMRATTTLYAYKVDKTIIRDVQKNFDNLGTLKNHFVTTCGVDGLEKAIDHDVSPISDADIVEARSEGKRLLSF